MISNSKFIYTTKYVVYVLVFILVAVLQSTPHILELSGVKPILLYPCAVSIAVLDGEFIGGIYGAVAGILCDYTMDSILGFNAIILLVCCVVIGLSVIYFIQNSLFNVCWLCGVTLLSWAVINFFFSYYIWRYENNLYMFLEGFIPTIIYTVVITPVVYYILKWIRNFFETKVNV